MNLVAAILILGATGHAERSMTTDASIGRIVAQCIAGGLNDVYLMQSGGSIEGGQTDRRNDESGRGWLSRTGFLDSGALRSVRLTIDGQPREGWRAWGESAWRVGGYVADVRSDGSVGLSYRLRIRQYRIATSTAVSDGRVEKVVDAWWTEVVVIPLPRILQRILKREAIVRRVPSHVTISIAATELDGRTILVGTATGEADTSEFCLDRIAERQAAAELTTGLDRALLGIQTAGIRAYSSGADIADVLDAIDLGIEIGGRLRR